MSGKIQGSQYDLEFNGLMHHFNMCQNSLQGFEGLDKFLIKYNLEHCQTAKQRLTAGKSGYNGEEADKGLAIRVMDITQKMIGAQDILEIDIKEVDQIFPAINEIEKALLNYPNLPPNNEGLVKVSHWVNILKTKNASDQLSDEEIRQLKLDLDSGY